MAETPQSLDLDLNRSNLLVNQRCGNCKHLRRIAHPAYEKLCKDHGMTDISRPCAKFSVDPTKIKFKGDKHARNAVRFLQGLSNDKLLAFASLIVEERRTRNYGFHFGETVYLKAFGDDYLSNYRRLKVISATRDYVNLQADDGFTAMVFKKSVLTPDQWLKKKKWLIDNERLKDPRYHKYTESQSVAQRQIQMVKDTLREQEFDATNRHDFALTSGRQKITKTRFFAERTTPIDQLVKIRTR